MASYFTGRRSRLVAATLVWGVVGLATSSGAQTVSTPSVKAAFLFNFVKFAVWPAEALAVDEPITLCVVGDDALTQSLAQIVKDQTIGGHGLAVRRQAMDVSMRSCHLLYAAPVDTRQSTELIDLLKDASVLTVSEADRFAPLGGVAQFFTDHGVQLHRKGNSK